MFPGESRGPAASPKDWTPAFAGERLQNLDRTLGGTRRAGLRSTLVALFFTSDTHFGDHRTLNIHKRPFASVAEMDEMLIRGWNAVVGDADDIWHLGDFARKLDDVPALLARLKGRKHLIRGNNDAPGIGDVAGWESVADYHEMQEGGQALVLCHYPFRSWNGQHRRAINLHGHSHGKLKPMPRQYDVGVDARAFRPVTLQALLAR